MQGGIKGGIERPATVGASGLTVLESTVGQWRILVTRGDFSAACGFIDTGAQPAAQSYSC
jgi:hypothetical protein